MTTGFDKESLEIVIFLEDIILRGKTLLKTSLSPISKKHKNLHDLMMVNPIILLKNFGKRLELSFYSEISNLDLYIVVATKTIIQSKLQFILLRCTQALFE